MSTTNSHGEEVFRDGEAREASPGTCPCCEGQERKVCGDCGSWLGCECGDPADCACTEEQTAAIPAETMAEVVFGKGGQS